MKPDDVLRAVVSTGGVIGMSAAPHTTLSAAHPRHSIESVMDHFRYRIDLVGLDHVTFGPDTLYASHVQLHRTFAHLLSLTPGARLRARRLRRRDGEPTENFTNICGWLVRHGFDDDATRRHRETSTGPCRTSGQPLTGRSWTSGVAAIPGLSDKDLTVEV
jgi:membrane dipeptidase